MKRISMIALLLTGLAFTGVLVGSAQDEVEHSKAGDSTGLPTKLWKRGLEIAPLPLNLSGRDRKLVGEGSFIVNAQAECNGCHTANINATYLPGGNPFLGQPEQINPDTYLVGGNAFGPFVSRNLRPDASGKPAGLTLEQFMEVLRTGRDFKDIPPSPVLQVMPWPNYRNMTDDQIRAIYEYLSALPPHAGFPQ